MRWFPVKTGNDKTPTDKTVNVKTWRHSLGGNITARIMRNFKIRLTLTPNPNLIPLAQFYEFSVLSKTPLFTEQKHRYCEAMPQGSGWGSKTGALGG